MLHGRSQLPVKEWVREMAVAHFLSQLQDVQLCPKVWILFLEATQAENIKNLVISPRIEKLGSTGKVFVIFLFIFSH